jgi:hypothetical protein
MNLIQAASTLQKFGCGSLTHTLARIEDQIHGICLNDCPQMLSKFGINGELLAAAALIKSVAGQVNVLIHAIGIVSCLPHILSDDEIVEYVSLGAGNTGRSFDLETSHKVAEFKFVRWRGGPEPVRQNQLFKDFFLLARNPTSKKKLLYVLGLDRPMAFFNGGRALSSVLTHRQVEDLFRLDFANRYTRVREYYRDYRDHVAIEDVSRWVPNLVVEAETTLSGEEEEFG